MDDDFRILEFLYLRREARFSEIIDQGLNKTTVTNRLKNLKKIDQVKNRKNSGGIKFYAITSKGDKAYLSEALRRAKISKERGDKVKELSERLAKITEEQEEKDRFKGMKTIEELFCNKKDCEKNKSADNNRPNQQ
jgi:hypothetical protein